MAEMGRKEALARLEMTEDRVFALSHKVAALEARERDLQEQLMAQRERVARLETERKFLQAEVDRAEELSKQLQALRSSRSYRSMQRLWRVRAAIRHPFSRSKRAAVKPAKAGPAKAAPATTRPEPAPKPAARAATAAPAAPGETIGDREHQRWLARASEGALDTGELKVAAIVDEISRACFEPDCRLLTFGPEEWPELLEEAQPHFLLVESAWQGNGGSWQYQVASYDHPDYTGLPRLKALLAWCREREIPTVFWNKEDPVHFARFSEAAALFDHVMTTDRNCIGAYTELDREGAGGVEALQFAAQPRVHNPIGGARPRSSSPCFAGAYYRDRHPERRRSLDMLLDAASTFGLVIYDRRLGSDDRAFGFPERFASHVQGSLPYAQMLDAYKAHKVFLNANSVIDSPTMFSRRVFELLACDTAVVSTESLGVVETFGDLVNVVETPEQARQALERLLGDDEYRRDLAIRARRLVLSEHTYAHRLAAVGRAVGYPVNAYEGERAAAVVLVDDVEDARAIRTLMAAVSSQTRPPAELLIGLGMQTSVAGDLQELSDGSDDLRVRVVQQDPGASRSQRFGELASLATSPWVAVLHTSHSYGPEHLRDLLNSTRFAHADVFGSASFELTSGDSRGAPDLEQRFTELVHPHSALVRRELIADRGWPDEMPVAWEALRAWFRDGVRFYSGDGVNFRADPALGVPPERPAVASAESR
jgi:spore maturation protein CgeB